MSQVDYSLKSYKRPKLETPNGEKKLLLHSCCAPCAGEIMEALAASDIDTTIYFYNPNIHPKDEYELRKDENIRFAEKLGMPIIDADYDRDEWFERTKGFLVCSGKIPFILKVQLPLIGEGLWPILCLQCNRLKNKQHEAAKAGCFYG